MSYRAEPDPAGEFASLAEVADELGLEHSVIPSVGREFIQTGTGQTVSAVRWGIGRPELVFLHGGGQNARTWDLVAMRIGRPAVAIDLPGHGHSSWRSDRDYSPVRSAGPIAEVIEQLAPDAAALVGMSLGGLTAIRVAAAHPELVRRMILVDVTPGSVRAVKTMTHDQRGTTALIAGPRDFATFDEMVELAVQASPRRSPASVRRGVAHNAVRQADGTWRWRYDLADTARRDSDAQALWQDVEVLAMPTLLVRGGASVFVRAEDLAELARRNPRIQVRQVDDAGHSVQSDQPDALSSLITEFVFS
ncbi:MAG TPA: alpha/beta hydrolase [Pseudonocardia sp.]